MNVASKPNKHAERSARTRQRFMQAAQKLFAERGVDAVSVNEITIAAGQKNRNALQYHFGNRNGLIQAIIDHHIARVSEYRGPILETLDKTASPAHNAARALVAPIIEYVQSDPDALDYVKLISQVAAAAVPETNPGATSALSFGFDERLRDVMVEAIAHLSQDEAQRRLFLVVTLTFRGVGDICKAVESRPEQDMPTARDGLLSELQYSVESILAAPSTDTAD